MSDFKNTNRESEEVATEARRLFSYDPETGLIIRLVNQAKTKAGSEAGCETSRASGMKYRSVCVFSRLYLGHRIAWLLHYGEWPSGMIDHRDGNGLNNKIDNLRISTNRDNLMNSSMSRRNTSGRAGVTWDKSRNKWKTAIRVNYKMINLGRFDSMEDAVKSREDAEKKYGFSDRHGSKRVGRDGDIR